MKKLFPKEGIQMVNKYVRRCSTSLAVGEMQIKATTRNHYTPIRIAKIIYTMYVHTQYQILVRMQRICISDTSGGNVRQYRHPGVSFGSS